MSDRTQDIKNLRAVAVASKNYIDKSIENLKWELGTYDLSVESDNTSALVKTMPSGTIKLNVNKIYGASEVAINLFDKSTALLGYQIDGNGTVFADENYMLSDYIEVKPSTLYSFYVNNVAFLTCFFDENKTSISGTAYTGNFTTTSATKYIRFTALKTRLDAFMLVKGTNIPSTYVEYVGNFDGIHNLELSGLKVEGSNIANIPNNTLSTNGYIIAWQDLPRNFEAGNYTVSLNWTGGGAMEVQFTTNDTSVVVGRKTINSATAGRLVFAITTTAVATKIRAYTSNTSGGTVSNVTVNRGSSDLGFVPYVSQTLPIDLTSIEDSGGNKLFADGSLKGVGNVADEITPYKAVKRFGVVDLGSLDWGYNSTTNRERFYANISGIKVPIDNNSTTNLLICDNYENVSFNTMANQGTDLIMAVGNTGNLIIRNFAYTDTIAFKTAMSGVYLVYELETPIEVSIDWSSTLRGITGYSNGSITAQNTYDMATTSEIDYLVEEVKA